MSDNSDFVLRWSFPKSQMVEGMSSPVMKVGGLEWKTELRALSQDTPFSASNFYFFLNCNTPMRGIKWSAETHVDYSFYDGATELCTQKTTESFNDAANVIRVVGVYGGTKIMGVTQTGSFLAAYPIAGRGDSSLTIECRIKIIQPSQPDAPIVSPVIDVSKFLSRNEHGNVTLVLGGEKLRVSRERLADHSPVFDALFFRGFAEKDREEIELKDVDYKEFVDLIALLFTIRAKITHPEVFHILPLADRFAMMEVIKVAEKHLKKSPYVSYAEKLLLADMHRLEALKEYCFQNIRNDDLRSIKETEEYAQLSASMQEELSNRLNSK